MCFGDVVLKKGLPSAELQNRDVMLVGEYGFLVGIGEIIIFPCWVFKRGGSFYWWEIKII